MRAGKKQHIAVGGARPLDHRIGARPLDHRIGASRDLIWRFTSRAAVTEELPIRAIRADFSRTQAFVGAIVPFAQIRIDFSDRPESRELARARRALQRARKDLGERETLEPFSKSAGIAFD